MLNKNFVLSSVAFALIASSAVKADSPYMGSGYFKFLPLSESANTADWDTNKPWKLPVGYTQKVVSDEFDLNIYDGGRDDWPDMNTTNETGPMKGRYLYRTHEVRGAPEGGAVTVVDLETGYTDILAQDVSYDALDGIRWTPWGTILFAEERTGGRLLEIQLNPDLMSAASVIDRPAVGRMAHEGIDIDNNGNVYIVDEHRGRSSGCEGIVPCGGGIYKFVPDVYGDLSSGDLYALKVNGLNGVGQGEWVGPIDAADARKSGSDFGGQSYQRPEDIEVIGDKLYVAITEGPREAITETDPGEDEFGNLIFGSEIYEGRIICIDLNTVHVSNFVKPGVNTPVEIGKPGEPGHQTGFDSVDNLAEAPNGQLILIEDNKPSDIWFADTKTTKFGYSERVELFASLTDPGAEGTGIYISPSDPKTLYVNVQHSAAEDGDGTWAITKKSKVKRFKNSWEHLFKEFHFLFPRR